jgi:hypothetical protein
MCRTGFRRAATPRIEAAGPLPRVGVLRVAGAHGDDAGLHVAVIDEPAIAAVGGSSAGKVGHGDIQARAAG